MATNRDRERPPRAAAALFLTATFLAAFLLFLVQPLVGKKILPWFGGSPGVWMLCLAFYQVTLFLGYTYAHALTRVRSSTTQVAIHALLLFLALAALPVLPDESWKPTAGPIPQVQILSMLTWHVALPFALLAASSPLIQTWFAKRLPTRSPYPLYAISNLGSLFALLAYPFWIEPFFPLSTAGRAWSLGFLVTAVVIVICAVLARGTDTNPHEDRPSRAALPLSRIMLWALPSATAVAILMGVTNKLTLDVASIPFLWVLPLGLYLVTFIASFASERSYNRTAFLLLVATIVVALQFSFGPQDLYARVLLYCALLFCSCMILHAELYRQRPPSEQLTSFYLSLSGGGAVAGLLVGIVAPQLFNDYYELPVSLAAGWILVLLACRGDNRSWLHRTTPRWRWITVLSATAAAFFAGTVALSYPNHDDEIFKERTFFGVLSVRESAFPPERVLMHGATLHGSQSLEPEKRNLPTSYYGTRTPVGVLMRSRPEGVDTRVGLIGMGIGTLAAYGRPGDLFRFYEVDPSVIRIAKDPDYFDVIAESKANVDIIEADGRLALEAELQQGTPPGFDILVLDAFNGDSVPLHLLTREAFETYRNALAPDGLLAFHVSNQHFRLGRPLSRVAASSGMRHVFTQNDNFPADLSVVSQWLFASPSQKRIAALLRDLRREKSRPLPEGTNALLVQSVSPKAMPNIPLWTDDHANLLGALARPSPGDEARIPAR